MSGEILIGLKISALGMGLVFITIVILILSMIVLKRVTPEKTKEEIVAEEHDNLEEVETAPAEAEEEIAAAVVIALERFLALEKVQSRLGSLLQESESPWAIASRQAQVRTWER